MSLPTLAITGVTGQLGRLVATNLAASGHALRLLARKESASRAPQLAGAMIAHADYGESDAAAAALAGARTLFMVSAAESADRREQHRSFISAATKAGVEHVVYTSLLGAAEDSVFTLGRDHFFTEQLIRASGMSFTFLRDSFYLDFLPLLAGEDGVIRGPAGDGVVGAVARADIARVAAVVLADPGAHAGQTYELTGREALSLTEIARILTEVTGKSVTYYDETIEEAHASRAKYGAPAWQVDAWITTYTAFASGEFAAVNDVVRQLTGREPLTLRELSTA